MALMVFFGAAKDLLADRLFLKHFVLARLGSHLEDIAQP